jgi:hypothetical protein
MIEEKMNGWREMWGELLKRKNIMLIDGFKNEKFILKIFELTLKNNGIFLVFYP